MKILFLVMLAFVNASYAQVLSPEILYKEVSAPGSCHFDGCYDLKTVSERAGKVSFDSQEGSLDLFQARQTIKIRVGQLLPSFNLRIKNPIDVFDYIPNLVGFLFPSNWYRLKESKLHAKAQEYSFISLVANQKSMGKGLYLSTHQEIISLKILENHIAFSSKLLELMNKRYEQGEVPYEDLAELNAFNSLILADKVTLESMVGQSSNDLAYLLTDVSSTQTSGPTEVRLPELTNLPKLNAKDFIEKVLQVSPELKSMVYLTAAARFSKKARAYEFLTPESGTDNAFGFGYMANIRIGASEQEKLNIKKRAYETNLKKTLNILIGQMNSAVEIHQYSISIETSVKYILESLLSDFNASSKIDINRYISIIKENLESQNMKYTAVHSYLLAKTQLERLLLESEEYVGIAKSIPVNNSSIDCYQKKENKMIKQAVNSGELTVPDSLTFENDELSFCL
jgi:hypothetical protein